MCSNTTLWKVWTKIRTRNSDYSNNKTIEKNMKKKTLLFFGFDTFFKKQFLKKLFLIIVVNIKADMGRRRHHNKHNTVGYIKW